jgi:phage terminase large subunit-like protein
LQKLHWNASNAVVRRDPAGNIKLDKEKWKKKIDGLAALVNAMAGAIQ